MKLKLYEGEYKVYMVNFHCGAITGALREDADGYPSIYIEDQCGPEGRRRAFDHEINHAVQGDLYSSADIREVEQCHGKKSNT